MRAWRRACLPAGFFRLALFGSVVGVLLAALFRGRFCFFFSRTPKLTNLTRRPEKNKTALVHIYAHTLWIYITLAINTLTHHDGTPEPEPVNGRYKVCPPRQCKSVLLMRLCVTGSCSTCAWVGALCLTDPP